MSLKSGFFNSVNHDRKYSSEDFARMINALVTDGIVTTKGEQFMTVPGEGLSVNVKSGFAWFNSTWSMSEDITPLTLDPADVTRARMDAIVIDIDHTDAIRDNKLMVVKGSPAASPVKPTLINTEKHHQHAIAYVSIPAAATSITAANIDIRVGHADCPFATGKLDVISVDTLFDAWEAEFDAWFSNLKAQLGDNIVTNLQQQIDQRVKIADKATDADILAATPNKWVDAAGVGKRVEADDIIIVNHWKSFDSKNVFIPADGRSLEDYPNVEKKFHGLYGKFMQNKSLMIVFGAYSSLGSSFVRIWSPYANDDCIIMYFQHSGSTLTAVAFSDGRVYQRDAMYAAKDCILSSYNDTTFRITNVKTNASKNITYRSYSSEQVSVVGLFFVNSIQKYVYFIRDYRTNTHKLIATTFSDVNATMTTTEIVDVDVFNSIIQINNNLYFRTSSSGGVRYAINCVNMTVSRIPSNTPLDQFVYNWSFNEASYGYATRKSSIPGVYVNVMKKLIYDTNNDKIISGPSDLHYHLEQIGENFYPYRYYAGSTSGLGVSSLIKYYPNIYPNLVPDIVGQTRTVFDADNSFYTCLPVPDRHTVRYYGIDFIYEASESVYRCHLYEMEPTINLAPVSSQFIVDTKNPK